MHDLRPAVVVRVRRLAHAEGVALPSYASAGAAGADVCSAEPGPVRVAPGERVALSTGLELEVPEGWELQVRPRSGLAWRQGLTVVNAPGTIDSDFRGEVKVLLVNLGRQPVTVHRGDRVAQLVLAPVTRAEFLPSQELSTTDRGAGGFGSTGR